MKGNLKLKLLFFAYIAVVFKVIIFKYPLADLMHIANSWEKQIVLEGLGSANFTLFKTIRMYIQYAYKLNSFENLIGNIVVFIPLGCLLPLIKRSCKNFFILLANVFLFVVGIEVFQLFSAFGVFDVDDILLNCFGAIGGFSIYKIWSYNSIKKESCKM